MVARGSINILFLFDQLQEIKSRKNSETELKAMRASSIERREWREKCRKLLADHICKL